MTFQEFIDKWNGKKADYDGYYGPQCMDLYRFYVKEVLDYPQSKPVPSAKDVWNNYPTEYYEKVPYSYGVDGQNGDIVIWGTDLGPDGHIAVFIEGDDLNFRSFDQNYPVGSSCHIQSHSYSGVLGFLRPKKNIVAPNPPQNEDLKNGLLTNFNFFGDKLPNGRRLQADTYITEEDKKKMWLDVGPNQYWAVVDTNSINFFLSLYRQYRDELIKLGYSFKENGDLIPPTNNSSAIKEEAVKQANRAKEAIDSIIALFSKFRKNE